MNRLLVCLLVFCSSSMLAAQETKNVSIKQQKGKLQIEIGGKSFATFNHDSELPKPFFLPVHAPDGTVLTRSLNDKKDSDHKHHKGIWVSVDEVNNVKFWNEDGKIKTQSVKVKKANGNPAVFEVVNHWVGTDGPIISETSTVSIHANGILAYDIVFQPVAGEVTFRDTKEGLFGFRMVSSMKEKETGKVINAEGKKGTGECWGQPSKWIDYSGKVKDKTYGLAIFDHPKNFRPSRYHVRNYGLFSINPFGEKAYSKGKNPAAPVTLKKDETLRLRYAMYVHQGDTQAADVAGAYKKWVAATQK